VVVLGGANDYLNGDAPLGQMGDTTLCTFYGAVRDLFTRLKDKYPTSKIIAITPPKYIKLQSNINAVGAERVGGIEVYAEAIKEVAAEMEIPVIDAYSTWAIDPRIDGDGEGKGHISVDRLHPNDDGHRFMAECFLNSLKNL
jgi:lysophospholipase L1-like esterase